MKNDDQTAKLMFQNFAFNIYDLKKILSKMKLTFFLSFVFSLSQLLRNIVARQRTVYNIYTKCFQNMP